ncbi:MAG: hypothetical protein IIT65_14805 [Lachnospiraceae bacterium]|nr:hypothetical protein [Lachnospiraceae bacterium]
MLNCIIIRDSYESDNIRGVILTEMSDVEVDKIKDTCDEGDEDTFIEKLKEKGCTIYGVNGEIEL